MIYEVLFGMVFNSFIDEARLWARAKGIQMRVTKPLGIVVFRFELEQNLDTFLGELRRAVRDVPEKGNVPAITHFDSALYIRAGKSHLIPGCYERKNQEVLWSLPHITATPLSMTRRA